MKIKKEAERLLAAASPALDEYPSTIEALELCSFDVQTEILHLEDRAAYREELAVKESIEETSETKRKALAKELLRADTTHSTIKNDIRALDRLRVSLVERAARLRREYRLALINLEIQSLRMRA